jgi:hypothetical protein
MEEPWKRVAGIIVPKTEVMERIFLGGTKKCVYLQTCNKIIINNKKLTIR